MRLERILPAIGVLLLAACGEPRRAEESIERTSSSRADLFLKSSRTTSADVLFVLSRVALRDAAGEEVDLVLERPLVAASAVARRLLIAGSVIEPATYEAVILAVSKAYLERNGQRIPLRLLPPPEAAGAAPSAEAPSEEPQDAEAPTLCTIPLRLQVRRHDAVSIFLDWNVAASVMNETEFLPHFSVSLETPQVRLELLYVADSATGSILALDRSSGQVVATAKVGTAPRALALARNRRLLYVANAGDGSLSIVDTLDNFTVSTIPIRLGARTVDVAIAEDHELVATANSGIDTVSIIDTRQSARIENIRVGRSPVRLAAAQGLRRLFVANALSDDVSVIDLSTYQVVASLHAESEPAAIALDRREREVFVAHRTSPNLLAIDTKSLSTVASIQVGDQVTAILADRSRDRLYVARAQPAELVVVDRRLTAVVRRIPLSGVVERLAQPVDGPLVFGAASAQGGLIVVDVVLNREQPLLPCGSMPADVVAPR
ncbi:MAG: hypothetical protein AB1486_27350 [Planctomycetota bacterium]